MRLNASIKLGECVMAGFWLNQKTRAGERRNRIHDDQGGENSQHTIPHRYESATATKNATVAKTTGRSRSE
jgi:hypothetical protein